MKGLFAKYGNNVYLLNEEPSNCYQNIDVKERQINYRYSEANNEASVNINLGLINDDYKTNKEVVDDITTYLKENKILSIGTLEPFFEVAIDFILLSENKVLDEGVMVRHCSKSEAFNIFRILGTDAENEMHHRLVKYINIPFKFNYRESVPCGIMGNPNKQFVLVIRNIIIHEIVYDKDAYINGLNDRMDIFHKCSEGVAVTRETYKMNYKKPQDIVVFDAKNEGIELDPIYIENRFRNLTLKISIILNNYFITYDRDTILNIITENSGQGIILYDIDHKRVEFETKSIQAYKKIYNDDFLSCMGEDDRNIIQNQILNKSFNKQMNLELLLRNNNKSNCYYLSAIPVIEKNELKKVEKNTIIRR